MQSIFDYQPDPVAFSLGTFDIMWYAVLICIGVLAAGAVAYKRAPRYGMKSSDVIDYILWCLPLGILGARAYYVTFNLDSYQTLYDIVNIRAGGLAIHGGLIAGAITAYFVCRYKKHSFWNVMDLAVPCVALAQAFGRWGNYFNQEAHGGETALPWGILIDGQYVHPTFLYESVWCLLLFIFLSWLGSRNYKNGRGFRGQICMLYGMLYSLERFLVESLRTDSLMLGNVKQAMLLSAGVFVLCLIGYILLKKGVTGDGSD